MTAEKRAVLDLLYNNPVQIGIWIGFKDLTDMHNSWLKSFLYDTDDITLLAHRGSYKTTTLSLALALFIILMPSKNVLFVRKTDTDVGEVIGQVKKILKTGVIHRIVRILYGIDLNITRETAAVVDTNLNQSTRGAPQLMGLGIGTSITGKHADVVVTDDIVNIEDRVSPSEREKTKLRYMELENIKNPGGRFINTGTPWHKEDAISLMPNVRRYDCYQTGLLTKAQIRTLQSKMTASLFTANYELKHIADTDAIFTTPQYTPEIARIHNGIGHIDASYGGSDFTAYTAIHEDEGELIVFGKIWNKHVDDCLEEILEIQKHLKCGTIWCEKNADKGYLSREIEDLGWVSDTYHESTNKHVKIVTYLKTNWDRIRFLDTTQKEYLRQILDYSEATAHDDAPDSLASAIRQLDDEVDVVLLPGGLI